jgi:mannan endo-1,4-beta-mannosidase
MLAVDVYRKDYKQSHHDQLAVLGEGKPIALGAVGEIPDGEVLEQQPQRSWFMPWGWILFMSNETDLINEVYHSDRFLTLDKLTLDKHGLYTVNM